VDAARQMAVEGRIAVWEGLQPNEGELSEGVGGAFGGLTLLNTATKSYWIALEGTSVQTGLGREKM